MRVFGGSGDSVGWRKPPEGPETEIKPRGVLGIRFGVIWWFRTFRERLWIENSKERLKSNPEKSSGSDLMVSFIPEKLAETVGFFPALPVGAVFGVTRAAFFRGYRGKGFFFAVTGGPPDLQIFTVHMIHIVS